LIKSAKKQVRWEARRESSNKSNVRRTGISKTEKKWGHPDDWPGGQGSEAQHPEQSMHDFFGYGFVEGSPVTGLKSNPSYSSQANKLNNKTEKETSISEVVHDLLDLVAHDIIDLVQMLFFRKISVQEVAGDFQFRSLGGFRFGRHDGNIQLGRSVEVLFVVWCGESNYSALFLIECSCLVCRRKVKEARVAVFGIKICQQFPNLCH
jgi:hypothetical protein